jgi:hypothetical protein
MANLYGDDHADILTGSPANDELYGGANMTRWPAAMPSYKARVRKTIRVSSPRSSCPQTII